MIKNKYIVVSIYILSILLILIGASYLLKPVERNSKIKLYQSKYETLLEGIVLVDVLDIDHPIISEKIIAKDSEGTQLVLYSAKDYNSFGEIELIIALDNSGNVVASKAVKVDQTFSQDDLANLIINMKDKTITTSPGSVTGVTIGSQTISNILLAIAEEHFKGLTEIELKFGRGVKLGKTLEVNKPGIVSKREVVSKNDVVGYVYELENEVIDETGKQHMLIEAYTDENGEVLFYNIISYENNSQDKVLIEVSDLLELIKGGN